MQKHFIDLNQPVNVIYNTLDHLQGTNPAGEHISFTNHYMMINNKPFFGICGEFHFSRYNWRKWEDEIIKMKMAGVNIIPTYIIWNHHEEIKGRFRWNGNFNIRYFVQLCQKHDIYVILRVGPFVHGEARNGGLPDWLYGEPCRVRSNDKRYLSHVKRYYHEIGRQINGLMYKDGGPIIGVQLDNEYCHAGAPWEMTTGTSNEWISNGSYDTDAIEHHKHIENLKEIAIEAGLIAPIYTGTGWGGAQASPDSVLPLWGGYAFWPWIFYDETIKENDRYLDEKIDISEEEKEILDRKINMITNIPNKRPSLTITYFKKDDKKSGGRYITKSCAIKKIDMIDRVISFIDDTKIALDDVIDIEDVSFDDL